jgi:hypothetical protein
MLVRQKKNATLKNELIEIKTYIRMMYAECIIEAVVF